MDDETKDKLAQLAAAADQAKGAMREIAHMLGMFRDELIEAGFERGEAMAMCLTQLQIIMANNGE